MLRILVAIVVGTVAGIALSQLQGSMMANSLEERFAGTLSTKAEETGEFKPEESKGTPTIVVSLGTEYDFGTMLHGETLSHDFVIKNVGDGPLNLEKAGSTCKCTVGEMKNNVLLPNEETTITLTWTANTNMPRFGQSATFVTNDPARPELKFTVMGRVANSIVSEPSELALGDIPATEATVETIYLFSYLDKDLTFEGFSWMDGPTLQYVKFDHQEVPVDSTGFADHANALRAYKVDVTFLPGMPLGPIAARIEYRTNHEDAYGTQSLTVRGRVVSDVSIVGGSTFDDQHNILNLGNVQSETGATTTLWLTIQGENRNNITPRVDFVEPSESMNVTLGEAKGVGKRTLIPIKIEVPVGAPKALYPGTAKNNFGKVVIKTDHETIKEIPIFVRLVVVE